MNVFNTLVSSDDSNITSSTELVSNYNLTTAKLYYNIALVLRIFMNNAENNKRLQ